MRHLMIRLASVLILALGLAPVASAQVWTFAHFAETEGTQTAKSFDSVLYLVNKGGNQVHTCWIDLFDKNNQKLRVNGREVCPSSPIPFCTVTVNGNTQFKIHDWIAYAAQGPWSPRVQLGYIHLRCSEPLASLNATLYVTNYHEDAFTTAFAVDHGKILP